MSHECLYNISWKPTQKIFCLDQSYGPTYRHCQPLSHTASMAKNKYNLGDILQCSGIFCYNHLDDTCFFQPVYLQGQIFWQWHQFQFVELLGNDGPVCTFDIIHRTYTEIVEFHSRMQFVHISSQLSLQRLQGTSISLDRKCMKITSMNLYIFPRCWKQFLCPFFIVVAYMLLEICYIKKYHFT